MIILDTNVLSALMQPDRNTAAIVWIAGNAPENLWTTVISLHEIQFGIEKLATGKKRRGLAAGLAVILDSGLDQRLLLLDADSAGRAAAARSAAVKATGHCDVPDALIAGIALTHGASVATRNISDFKHFGVPLIDPWLAAAP